MNAEFCYLRPAIQDLCPISGNNPTSHPSPGLRVEVLLSVLSDVCDQLFFYTSDTTPFLCRRRLLESKCLMSENDFRKRLTWGSISVHNLCPKVVTLAGERIAEAPSPCNTSAQAQVRICHNNSTTTHKTQPPFLKPSREKRNRNRTSRGNRTS